MDILSRHKIRKHADDYFCCVYQEVIASCRGLGTELGISGHWNPHRQYGTVGVYLVFHPDKSATTIKQKELFKTTKEDIVATAQVTYKDALANRVYYDQWISANEKRWKKIHCYR